MKINPFVLSYLPAHENYEKDSRQIYKQRENRSRMPGTEPPYFFHKLAYYYIQQINRSVYKSDRNAYIHIFSHALYIRQNN